MAIEEAQQHIIVSNLIQAIEAALLQQQTTAADADALARSACHKLQFDFPSCSTSELQALSEELCRGGNATPRHLQLSAKIVTNVMEGAAVLVGPQKHDDVQLSSGSATPDHQAAAGADAGGSAATTGGMLDQANGVTTPQIMQQSYSQLAATILISLVGGALAHPEEHGWRLVSELGKDTDRVSSTIQGETTVGSRSSTASVTAPALISNTPAPGHGINTTTTRHSPLPAPTAHTLHPAMEAEESDEDDFIFEDIETSSSLHALHHALQLPPHGQHAPTLRDIYPPYNADELLHSLLWLSSHVSYSLLGAAAVFKWQDTPSPSQQPQPPSTSSATQTTPFPTSPTPPASAALSPALLQVLGAYVHSPFEAASLLLILHPYTTLIADAIAEHPQCIASLQQLWTILAPSGATDQTTQHNPCKSARPQQVAQTLQTFPSLALELASGLCTRVVVPAAKAELWRQIHAQLLPALLRQLLDLSHATSNLTHAPALQAVRGGQVVASLPPGNTSEGWSTGLDAIQQTCPLVSFYLRQAPRNAQPSQQLLDAGLIAPLVMMWVRFGFLPPAEPLRVAALLAAAGSPAVLRWMLAVPGFSVALRCNVTCEGGVAAEHGCVWQLLVSDLAGSASASKGSGSSAAAVIADALAATGQPDRAERLLLAAAAAVNHPSTSNAPDSSAVGDSLSSRGTVSRQTSCDVNQALGAELAAAHALLQLLASACELSPRTASMLTFPLAPALKQLETALRSSHGSCGSSSSAQDSSALPNSADNTDLSPAVSVITAGAFAAAEMCDGGLDMGGSVPAQHGDVLKDHEAESEGVQSSRHSKGMLHLRGSAMKLIKTLLTSQGKTD